VLRLPIVRALAAQGVGLALVAAYVRTWPGVIDLTTALLCMGGAAAALGWLWRLPWWWVPIQVALPWAVASQAAAERPPGIYLAALVAALLLFGGGVWTRVPLYNSNRAAWHELLALIPDRPGVRFVDLGAGLAGPLAYLARQRPDACFVGVEASPLVWWLAWLRTLPVRRNCRVRWGSLWSEPLGSADVVYAFLSPAPMPALWEKARQEMRSGSVLISNTFTIPAAPLPRRIDLTGRPDACLLVWTL
jgi:hypothetical protein